MKITKKQAIILAISAVILIIAAFSVLYLTNHKDDAKKVKEMPEGYISLNDAIVCCLDKLKFEFNDGLATVSDENGECLYQTKLSNSDFIVTYKEQYYINEEKFRELLGEVITIPEGYPE